MATTPDFPTVFDQLKAILKPYEPRLSVTADGSEGYSLDSPKLGPNKKPMFFGAAAIKKNYVSFHLMPVYVHPELLEGISDGLRKRMQGKSCFNFKALNEDTLAELRQLTERGFEALRKDGLV
jgi:hypothetical protein